MPPQECSPSADNSLCELLRQITFSRAPPLVPQEYRILCAQTKIRLCLNSYAKLAGLQRQRSRAHGRHKVVFLLPFYYDRRLQRATPVVKPRLRQSTRFFEFQLDQADAERCAFQEGGRERTNAGRVSAVSNRSYFGFDVVYTSKVLPRSARTSAEESEAVVQSVVRESFRLARRNFDSDLVVPQFETGCLSPAQTGLTLVRNIVQTVSFYALRGEQLPFAEVCLCTRSPEVYLGWVRGMQTAFPQP